MRIMRDTAPAGPSGAQAILVRISPRLVEYACLFMSIKTRLCNWWRALPVELRRRISDARRTATLLVFRRRFKKLIRENATGPAPPPLEPIWPLPRCVGGPSEQEIRARFAPPSLWHYNYRFEGGLDFEYRYVQPKPCQRRDRPLSKFRHIMPWLLQATGNSFSGKRVLDIGCNSGFWAIQCALLGAGEVVGIDARPELVDQANFVRSIVGLENVRFRALNFWDTNPEALGGKFDVVLSLAVLFHLADPLAALERMRRMARGHIVLETKLCRDEDSVVRLHWEKADDINLNATPGVVAWPSKSAVELMFRHLGLFRWMEIPARSVHADAAILTGERAAWLIDVR
jgi:tRNA (mo5U34)-methyltransferase